MIDKNILRFEVTMQNSSRVDIGYSIEYLLQDHLNLLLIDFVILTCDVFFEVEIIIIEHYLQQLLFRFVHNVDKGDDVGVFFERFEEGYLSER